MFMQPQQFASQIEFLETGHRQYDVACADECMVQYCFKALTYPGIVYK